MLRKEIKKLANPEKGEFLQRFFSVEDRARGDRFLGLTVPKSRITAKKFQNLEIEDVKQLLNSEIHEERLIALFILVSQFKKGNEEVRKNIFNFYLQNSKYVNHWDLVDSSADKIVGEYLRGKPKKVLYKLAESKIWWVRRIAIIATFQFLKEDKDTVETYKIAEILINDKHDLIHKAVGWMLREAGEKVSEKELISFLKKHYKEMPRTMLRYSIEKFSEEVRKKFLSGLI